MEFTAPVTVYEPDASWKHQFEQERELLVKAFGGQLIAYHHVGSTAIAHLAARPILDIVVEVVNVQSLDSLKEVWARLRLQDEGCGCHVNYRLLRRMPPKHPLEIHIFEQGDPQVHHWLNLHAFLQENPSVCHLYGRLKRKLMVESRGDLLSYQRGKFRFLQQAMVKACGYRISNRPPTKALERFMSIEQVGQRVWDSYCLYLESLYRFHPLAQSLFDPAAQQWLYPSDEPALSPTWRFHFSNQEQLLHWRSSCLKSSKARSFLTSPFDQPRQIEQHLRARHQLTRTFSLLPCRSFMVYDEPSVRFTRVACPQELAPWTRQIAHLYPFDGLHEFFKALPTALYAHGQPLELFLAHQGDECIGACALFFYRESLGMVEMAYSSEHALRSLVNFGLQRAHALDYPYLFAQVPSNRADPLFALGFHHLFSVQQWSSISD